MIQEESRKGSSKTIAGNSVQGMKASVAILIEIKIRRVRKIIQTDTGEVEINHLDVGSPAAVNR